MGKPLTVGVSGISDPNGVPDNVQDFTYQWYLGDQPISGATAPHYWPTSADVGNRIVVDVSFTDGDGFDEGPVASLSTTPVQDSATVKVPFSATVTVGVSGTLSGYDTATNSGTLTPSTLTIAGNLYSVGGVIYSGGTDNAYRIAFDPDMPTDFSFHFGADQTGHLSGAATTLTLDPYSVYIFSASDPMWNEGDRVAVAVRLENAPATGAPSFSGVLEEGETLTADTVGIADGNGLGDFSYQWLRDGSPISGATGSTYTLAADDVGRSISLRVTFTDKASFSESLTSAESGDVVAENATRRLLWLAEMTVGEIGANFGFSGFNDKGELARESFEYNSTHYDVRLMEYRTALEIFLFRTSNLDTPIQVNTVKKWKLSLYGQEISLADADFIAGGFQITASQMPAAVQNWGGGETLTVSLTEPVNVAAIYRGSLIDGPAGVDGTLSANTDGIEDPNGTINATFTYQWIRTVSGTDGDISGETDQTYTVTSTDAGNTIKVKVSFKDNDGFDESLTSEATTEVTAAGPVLVKNTDQSVTGDGSAATSATFIAYVQAFQTGTAAHGYDLTAIGVSYAADPGNTVVTLREANGSNVGLVVCTLTHPSSYTSDGVNTFLVPTTGTLTTGTLCPVLDPGTTYFVQVERSYADATLHWTSSPDEDGTPAAGWSIADAYHRLNFSTLVWSQQSGRVLKIEVRGTEAPAPVVSIAYAKDDVYEGTDSRGGVHPDPHWLRHVAPDGEPAHHDHRRGRIHHPGPQSRLEQSHHGHGHHSGGPGNIDVELRHRGRQRGRILQSSNGDRTSIGRLHGGRFPGVLRRRNRPR